MTSVFTDMYLARSLAVTTRFVGSVSSDILRACFGSGDGEGVSLCTGLMVMAVKKRSEGSRRPH